MSNSSDPMDCSLPGSSIHGIFQAKALEWGAIAFSAYKTASGMLLYSTGGSAQCSGKRDGWEGGSWVHIAVYIYGYKIYVYI